MKLRNAFVHASLVLGPSLVVCAAACTATITTGPGVPTDGVSGTSYTIGGNVSGLVGRNLTLQNNGGDTIAAAGNGAFAFPTAVYSGNPYNVAIALQPISPAQTCTVTSGSGVVGSSDVTNVAIPCIAPTFSVGGTVSGLHASGLVLQNDDAETLPIGMNGAFSFPTKVATGASYAVAVLAQPSGQVCTVMGGSGTLATTDVASVVVSCQ
jgi:hypothetical protein